MRLERAHLVEDAQIEVFLVLLEGLDESAAAPTVERLDNPVLSATFAFYRAVPFYLRDDDQIAADLASGAVALARSAGALFQLAVSLLGQGGWRARLPDATNFEVFGPLVESLDLWERLRIPWGRIVITEEIAQALAIRGHPEEAYVLWGAADASGIQAPAKIGRDRRAGPYIALIPTDQTHVWHSRGAAMTLDHAITFARQVLVAILARHQQRLH